MQVERVVAMVREEQDKQRLCLVKWRGLEYDKVCGVACRARCAAQRVAAARCLGVSPGPLLLHARSAPSALAAPSQASFGGSDRNGTILMV